MMTTVTTSGATVPPPALPAIDCLMVNSFEELATVREEWDAFIQSVGGDIYMTYDWCRTWWEYYGDGRELRILLFRDRSRLVGIAPVFIERAWLGPVWLRLSKLVGADSSLTLCNPPVHLDFAESVFDLLLAQLIGKDHCDAVWFGPISGTYQATEAIRQACQYRTDFIKIVHNSKMGVHTLFRVLPTMDGYLKSIGSNKRSQYRKKSRQLEKRHKIRFDVIKDAETAEREFSTFRQLHESQWHAQRKLGHFDDWPQSVKFNLALIRSMADAGRLRLLKKTADERVIAYYYGFVFGAAAYARFAARAIGPDWDEFGLGTIGLVEKMEMSIKEGRKWIEAGIGHYDYKLNWGGEEYAVRSILVAANRIGPRLRCTLFFRFAALLNLLYYRIWFLRVAPKLPFRRRPLWRLWIRSRI
jgi:CelD/BcsL family acetyltransferase involved in cellulose biosynthesis